MDSRTFKKLALNKIIESKEFKNRNIVVINNIFNDEDNESNLLNISKVKLPFKIVLKQKIRYILKCSAKYLNPIFDNEFGSIIKDKIKRALE